MTIQPPITNPKSQGFLLAPCPVCGAAMRLGTTKSTNPVALGSITMAHCSNEANHPKVINNEEEVVKFMTSLGFHRDGLSDRTFVRNPTSGTGQLVVNASEATFFYRLVSCHEINHPEPIGLSDEGSINYPQSDNDELRDLIESRHICDDESYGCEIEEFKGNWPGAVGVYFRCKLKEKDLANIESYNRRYAQKMVLEELTRAWNSPRREILDRITTLEKELKHE